MPVDQQAAARGRLHGVPLQPALRLPAAGRHHQPDPGHRAVERHQPGHRPALCAAARTTRTAGVEQWGWAVGKTDGWQATASYVTGAHNMKVGYQGNRLDQLDQTLTDSTQLAYRFNQGVPNAVTYRLPDFGAPHAHEPARRLRPGQLDARPPDAAGRAALRPRLELLAGRGQRHHARRRS